MTTSKATTTQAYSASNDQSDSETPNQPLPLPEPPAESSAPTLDVSTGEGVKLDHLGPMVVNRDGTLSRIGNWEQMTEIEKRNTLRILGKRNQLRMDALRGEEGGKSG
jgi:hypothetical protein